MTDVVERYDADIAQAHLSQRYATGVERDAWVAGVPLEPVEALEQVCRAERGERDRRRGNDWPLAVPRKVDIAAGLSLLEPVRADLERYELLLITGARARGLTWEQIAEVLGLESRQAAEQRSRRLRERWRDVTPHEPPAVGREDGELSIPPEGYLRAR
jgi:hypothetical protein